MARFPISDFVPPIIPRIKRLLDRSFGSQPRFHPFDQVPKDIRAKIVMDVGANVGDVTLAALKTYPDCHVICFEPVDSTFEVLKKRLSSYEGRFTLHQQALSSVNGVGEINITTFHGANSISAQSKLHSELNPHVKEIGKQSISLVRLDDLMQHADLPRVDIMKIDVEGHEYDVIDGGRYFLRSQVDTILIEASLMRDLTWDRQSFIEVFSTLSDLGFRLINAYDLHYVEDASLMCVQMDCVFRHRSKLT